MRLHYGRMLADALDGTHGLPRPRLDDLVQRFPQILDEVRARRRAGEYGFYGLGEQTETVRAIRRFAECLSADKWPGYADDVVQIGLPGWDRKTIDEDPTLHSAAMAEAA